MPIKYICSSCGLRLSVATRMAGQTLPCPTCGYHTVVPPAEESESTTQAPPPVFFRSIEAPLESAPEPGPSPPAAPPSIRFAEVKFEKGSDEDVPPETPPPEPPVEKTENAVAEVEVAPDASVEEPPRQPETLAPAFRPLQPQLEEFSAEPAWSEPETAVATLDAGPFSTRKRALPDDEMDLTSMVDMTFLLLIFFMVTASFSIQKSLEMPAPGPDQQGASQTTFTPEELEQHAVMVRIDAANRITVDDLEVAGRSQLGAALREGMNSQRTEIVVMPAPETLHETVVEVIDAANEVGMQRIRLASSGQSDD